MRPILDSLGNRFRVIIKARAFVAVSCIVFCANSWADEATAPVSVSIDLREALRRALESSPDLAVFSWDLRGAEARLLQAHARPNPDLIVEVEDVRLSDGPSTTVRSTSVGLSATGPAANGSVVRSPGDSAGFGDAQVTARLSQVVELGGKRMKRIHAAEREQAEISLDYEVARLDVLEETATRFVEVLAAQDRVSLSQDESERADQVTKAVALRVEAGKVSPIEQTRAESEKEQAQLALARSQRELEVAKSSLGAMWGSTVVDFSEAIGNLAEISVAPSLDVSLNALKQSPELARWNASIESREATLAVQRAARRPDLTVEAGLRTQGLSGGSERGYSLESGGTVSLDRSETSLSQDRTYSVVLGFSLPLPLFDRKKGAVQEAEYAVEKAHEEERRAMLQLEGKVHTAFTTLTELYSTIQTLQGSTLPKAQDVLEKTREGYREGKFGLLEVLDAQRAFLEAERGLLDARVEYHLTMNTLERITGNLAETAGAQDTKAGSDDGKQ